MHKVKKWNIFQQIFKDFFKDISDIHCTAARGDCRLTFTLDRHSRYEVQIKIFLLSFWSQTWKAIPSQFKQLESCNFKIVCMRPWFSCRSQRRPKISWATNYCSATEHLWVIFRSFFSFVSSTYITEYFTYIYEYFDTESIIHNQ